MSCVHAVRKDDKTWKMQCGREYWLVICTNEKCPMKGDSRASHICKPEVCKFYKEKTNGNRHGEQHPEGSAPR